MSMLYPIGRVLLHLRKHIAYDAWEVIGCLLRARDIDGNVGELGPGEGMVEIVFHKIATSSSASLYSGFEKGARGNTSRADW